MVLRSDCVSESPGTFVRILVPGHLLHPCKPPSPHHKIRFRRLWKIFRYLYFSQMTHMITRQLAGRQVFGNQWANQCHAHLPQHLESLLQQGFLYGGSLTYGIFELLKFFLKLFIFIGL